MSDDSGREPDSSMPVTERILYMVITELRLPEGEARRASAPRYCNDEVQALAQVVADLADQVDSSYVLQEDSATGKRSAIPLNAARPEHLAEFPLCRIVNVDDIDAMREWLEGKAPIYKSRPLVYSVYNVSVRQRTYEFVLTSFISDRARQILNDLLALPIVRRTLT